MIRSGVSAPLLSPSRIIRSAGRSFTDPPALRNSALPNTATPGNSRSNRRMRSSGVLPMPPRIEVPSVTGATRSGGAPRVVLGMAPLSVATPPCRPAADSAANLLLRARGPEAEARSSAPSVLDDGDDTSGAQVDWPLLPRQLDEIWVAVADLDGGDGLSNRQLDDEVGSVGESDHGHVGVPPLVVIVNRVMVRPPRSPSGVQGRFELAPQCRLILDADAEAQQPVRYAECLAGLRTQVAVRRRRGMAHRGAHIAQAWRQADPTQS